MQETRGTGHLGPEMPCSEPCERNKAPILEMLQAVFCMPGHILEIGSGTGQHAVHFAAALPHLTWQTSDLPENHAGIRMWLQQAVLDNVLPPISLDVAGAWPERAFDGIFTANTLHILSWEAVQHLFAGAGRVLKPGGQLVIYGPFNYGGAYTSESNARFDEWLKNREPRSAIRDFEAVSTCAGENGLRLIADHAMPANNRLLIFSRI
jgi:SAM-dependent methyltransferase